MKMDLLKKRGLPIIAVIAICGLAAGCGEKEPEEVEPAQVEPAEPTPPPKPPPPAQRPAPNVKPAVRTSFTDVAKRLDTGGSVYAYLSTEQWVRQLTPQLEMIEPVAEELLKKAKVGSLGQTFEVLRRILDRSGLQDVTGVGFSAFSLENGLHRSKTLLHRKGNSIGYVWSFAPPIEDPLPGVDLFPAGTVYATYADLDYAAAWKVLSDEIAIMGTPELKEQFRESQDSMRKAVGVDVAQFLTSVTDGMGMVVTSNPEEQLTLGNTNKSEAYKIDRPDFALIVGAKDAAIYNSVVNEFANKDDNKQVVDGTLRMMVLQPINEDSPQWRWTVGFDGEHLMFGTGESVIRGVVAAKAGKGLRQDTDFENLANNAPTTGRMITYSSDRFAALKRDLHLHLSKQEEAEMGDFLQGFMEILHPGGSSISVMQANSDGWLWTSLSSKEPARQMLTTGIIKPLKLVATIAIPGFKAGRARAQRNSCVRNQEKIDEAKRKWATKGNLQPTAVPSTRSLLRIMGSMPSCPNGGTYNPQAVAELCTCSHPGHSRTGNEEP